MQRFLAAEPNADDAAVAVLGRVADQLDAVLGSGAARDVGGQAHVDAVELPRLLGAVAVAAEDLVPADPAPGPLDRREDPLDVDGAVTRGFLARSRRRRGGSRPPSCRAFVVRIQTSMKWSKSRKSVELPDALDRVRREREVVPPRDLEQRLGPHGRLEVDVQLDLRVGGVPPPSRYPAQPRSLPSGFAREDLKEELGMARAQAQRRRRAQSHARKSARSAEDLMFFPKLRRRAKWVFLLLAIAFGIGFVAFGVGTGVSGTSLGDVLRDLIGQQNTARLDRRRPQERRSRTRRTPTPSSRTPTRSRLVGARRRRSLPWRRTRRSSPRTPTRSASLRTSGAPLPTRRGRSSRSRARRRPRLRQPRASPSPTALSSGKSSRTRSPRRSPSRRTPAPVRRRAAPSRRRAASRGSTSS